MTMKITRKGQVMIPKLIRDRLGIHAGSKVDFEVADDGRVFLRKAESLVGRRGRFERKQTFLRAFRPSKTIGPPEHVGLANQHVPPPAASLHVWLFDNSVLDHTLH